MSPAARSLSTITASVPPLTMNITMPPPNATRPTAAKKLVSAPGAVASDADHEIGGRPDALSENRAEVVADEDGDHQRAADDGHGERKLEEGLDRELDENDRPVGGGDERAVLECGS